MSPDSQIADYLVAAFYHFADLPDWQERREPLLTACSSRQVLGTILIAAEGINGTIAGPDAGVHEILEHVRGWPGFADLSARFSRSGKAPFEKLKVRLRPEIVTLGVTGVSPPPAVGTHVAPEQWNELIARPEVRLIDTRNDYEVHLGSFRGAENPHTGSFREFPAWAASHLDPERDQHVAMFCTGGIRCEKATAYLLQQGFRNVYHLQGGILAYLEQVDEADSAWEGDCFVFDDRVTVDHQLRPGDLEVCPACRMPVSPEDRQSAKFELHVCCPRCFDRLTPERRAGLLERARQLELARARSGAGE